LRHNSNKNRRAAYRIGVGQARGDLAQLLGTFEVLGEYEDLILLSTTSRQASMDLIGVKPDCIDFVECKKRGAVLQTEERKIKLLVDQKKMSYKILEVELAEGAHPKERL
jgi:hypothetical protein